jgi:hypothetical protein
MRYLQTIGGVEALGFIVLVSIALAVRFWIARADRAGLYDRSRYVYRRGTTASDTGPWASPHQRSAAERHQPEQELAPLPFRDQVAPEGHPGDHSS